VTKVVSLDFELASTLDLGAVGPVVWTRHAPPLPILCGYALDLERPWCIIFDLLSGEGDPSAINFTRKNEEELLDAIADGAEIHAWNANFEWNVWNNICVPRFGWPALPIERFHCTMCAAACAGLPMSLDEAAVAVGSPFLKNKVGHALMLRMARPRVNTALVTRWWHREDPDKLKELIAYNIDDVKAEREVHLRIPRMTKREREIWLVDQGMNARGLPIDQKLLADLHGITLQELLALNTKITQLTNGQVAGSTQNLKLLAWVQHHGYPHPTLERDVLLEFIKTPEFWAMAREARGVLMARAEAAKTSTAKLISMAAHQLDGRIRNLIQYGGAVRTLRWAGRGPQIQNYPRPLVKHITEAINEIKLGMDANGLRWTFGKPLDVVASCLRGVFEASPGKTFVIADYHAIEAVVLAWLAEDQSTLDVFRRKEDIYIYTAAMVGSTDRQLGKVLRLACGYGMGHVKFKDTAATYNVTLSLAEAKAAVDAFRLANKLIVSLWHGVEATATNAIRRPNDEFAFRKLKFRMANPKGRLAGSLLMTLPSGRNLVYRNVRIDNERIIFWGVDSYTRRWKELDTYGGKLVENATQAVARDLLADAIVEFDRAAPNTLCTTIHDEIIAECSEAVAPDVLKLMLAAMGNPQPWATGMPVSANGWIDERYGKGASTPGNVGDRRQHDNRRKPGFTGWDKP
jgi:DNA polymerase bacteriophage-type